MLSQNIPNKLSRRKWLRDAAIATTGAVVLPSLLTGCTDHPPGLGSVPPVGSVPSLSDAEWGAAAQNLRNMVIWLDEVKGYNAPYVETVYHMLKSGDNTNEVGDFFVDLAIEIATAMFEVALEAVPGAGAFLGAAFAIAGMTFKAWESERNKSTNIDATIGTFENRYANMQLKITKKLGHLANMGEASDPGYPYKNLKDVFSNGPIELLGKTYSPRELAYAYFPCTQEKCNSDLYYALRDAAVVGFRRFIWKTMIIELGDFHSSDILHPSFFNPSDDRFSVDEVKAMGGAVGLARKEFYGERYYSSTYIGGLYNGSNNSYSFRYWYFTFGSGGNLSAEAAEILFKDDTPEHIIDPNKSLLEQGLFTRDCVFKQFHKEKQKFYDYRELGKEAVARENPLDEFAGLIADTYVFVGGKSKC